MTALVPVDSRQYIIAFEIKSPSDVPPDFGQDALPAFDAGLFLPRAEPDWFGRIAYPPRLVALAPDGLTVVPHPAWKGAAEIFPFDRLAFVETGHMLLRGWLRFVGDGYDRTLPYNTRGAPVVEAFLRKLRARPPGAAVSTAETGIDAESALDLKFRNALSQELDAGEIVRALLFRPATPVIRRPFGIKRTTTIPADLVALTSRRLLWITDGDGRGYARYGTIARYAPLSRIAAIRRDPDRRILRVVMSPSGVEWRIPAAAEWLSAGAVQPFPRVFEQ